MTNINSTCENLFYQFFGFVDAKVFWCTYSYKCCQSRISELFIDSYSDRFHRLYFYKEVVKYLFEWDAKHGAQSSFYRGFDF